MLSIVFKNGSPHNYHKLKFLLSVTRGMVTAFFKTSKTSFKVLGTLESDSRIVSDELWGGINPSSSEDTLWGVETPVYSSRPSFFCLTVKCM